MSEDARTAEESATSRRAGILQLEYFNTSTPGIIKQLYPEILSKEELYQLKAVPLTADEHHILFGVTNSTSQQTMQSLRQRFLDQRINFALISDVGYRQLLAVYNPPKPVVYQDISLNQAGQAEIIKSVSTTLEQVKADDILAYLVQQGHNLNASDIHVETQEDQVRIRFRIDGVLHSIAFLSFDKFRILLSAIASAGNISTASSVAQQGHINQKVKMADGKEVLVNIRLETAATVNGTDVVMRLFHMDQEAYKLDNLGLSVNERREVDSIIAKPSGLVLIVGPTGSGKTTTLYSMLNSLNNDERKIITIEDPVEYNFKGITQISLGSDNLNEQSFSERLRATLRLDPDVVMVGEIRDSDTARTALQGALTGHLVLSTFHSSSSAAALTRLVDVIGQNPLFVSAIRLIMAQRLVRRLDDKSKVAYQPDGALLNQIKEVINNLPVELRPDMTNLTLYKPQVSADNPYGYKGQLAIREQMTMSQNVRALLESQPLATSQQIEAAAINDGMITMLQDGILKVLKGLTSIDEIYRSVG